MISEGRIRTRNNYASFTALNILVRIAQFLLFICAGKNVRVKLIAAFNQWLEVRCLFFNTIFSTLVVFRSGSSSVSNAETDIDIKVKKNFNTSSSMIIQISTFPVLITEGKKLLSAKLNFDFAILPEGPNPEIGEPQHQWGIHANSYPMHWCIPYFGRFCWLGSS
jgi:hypothetical protein